MHKNSISRCQRELRIAFNYCRVQIMHNKHKLAIDSFVVVVFCGFLNELNWACYAAKWPLLTKQNARGAAVQLERTRLPIGVRLHYKLAIRHSFDNRRIGQVHMVSISNSISMSMATSTSIPNSCIRKYTEFWIWGVAASDDGEDTPYRAELPHNEISSHI